MSTIYLTLGKYKVAAQNQQNFFFRHHTDSWKCKENSVFGSLLNNCVCNQKVKIIPFLKILMHSLNRRLLLGFPTNVNTLEVSKNINFILWGDSFKSRNDVKRTSKILRYLIKHCFDVVSTSFQRLEESSCFSGFEVTVFCWKDSSIDYYFAQGF